MPFRDGTGPNGKGAKTGLGLGNCDDEGVPKESIPMFFGRGMGRGFGKGRGFRARQRILNKD